MHTPEPWIVCTNSLDNSLSVEQDRAALEAAGSTEEPTIVASVDDMGDGLSREIGEANAARIVACVNACAGLEDPESDLDSARAILGQVLALGPLTRGLESRLRALQKHLGYVRVFQCELCDFLHPHTYGGDCRGKHRLTPLGLDARYGVNGWQIVAPPT